jgi:asparagine synthase (glutamine-hydrolysing)
MSAIWGVINTNGKVISKEIQQSMIDPLSIYKLDLIKSLDKNNVILGCGLQFITPESLHEVLPYYDESKGFAITADAIIDNREELFSLLNISVEDRDKITDSELILKSYEKWEKDCPKYLVGDFAFALWNEKNNELFCARDHVGARTLYYYCENNVFAFCTVVKPLFAICDKSKDINEKWATEFLALPGVVHQLECEETIYKDIYQLPPAHTITFNKVGVSKEQYWNPLENIKPLKLKSDREYDEAFKKVFFEAVNCRLRSNGDIGIMLSGGLDSGSVACIAAKKLASEGKRLKAFSAIPMDGFKDKTSTDRVADESEYIESISDFAGNIDVTYCQSKGKDSFNKIDWFINILEQPYKNIENSFWADEIVQKASQSGCKSLLTGQYGNATVSYGEFFTHIDNLFKRGSFIKILNEINGTSKLYNASKFYVGKAVCKSLIPYNLRKFIHNRNKKNNDDEKYNYSPVNKNLLKKWDIEKRLEEKGFNINSIRNYDLKEARKFIVNPVAFTQIGIIETKSSLAYGIMRRDPTKDKRVIEFCISLPSDQFVRNGQERHLIRRSMEGILPDKVRLNVRLRGLQSADWMQRLELKRKEIYNELEKILENEMLHKYIDFDKLKQEMNLLKDDDNEINMCNIRMILVTLIFSRFININ